MTRPFLTFLYCSLTFSSFAQQKIGLVDLYGHQRVSASAIREALHLLPGDTIDAASFDRTAVRQRLLAVPGVQQAAIDLVCCDDSTGGAILYIGIAEKRSRPFVYRTDPQGPDRLPDTLTSIYDAYWNALVKAVQRGEANEDHDAGYALLQDTAARRQQVQMIPLVHQFQQAISAVLHHSGDARQRAIAATVIAYSNNKAFAAQELLYAVYDRAEEVRNNATRALWVLSDYLNEHPDSSIAIPASPFIGMLNSMVWTDRNKGSLVLFSLSQQRPPLLLAELKKRCLPALIDMARWRNRGHAFQAYLILGRIAGVPDEDCFNAFNSDRRAAYLDQLLSVVQKH